MLVIFFPKDINLCPFLYLSISNLSFLLNEYIFSFKYSFNLSLSNKLFLKGDSFIFLINEFFPPPKPLYNLNLICGFFSFSLLKLISSMKLINDIFIIHSASSVLILSNAPIKFLFPCFPLPFCSISIISFMSYSFLSISKFCFSFAFFLNKTSNFKNDFISMSFLNLIFNFH